MCIHINVLLLKYYHNIIYYKKYLFPMIFFLRGDYWKNRCFIKILKPKGNSRAVMWRTVNQFEVKYLNHSPSIARFKMSSFTFRSIPYCEVSRVKSSNMLGFNRCLDDYELIASPFFYFESAKSKPTHDPRL